MSDMLRGADDLVLSHFRRERRYGDAPPHTKYQRFYDFVPVDNLKHLHWLATEFARAIGAALPYLCFDIAKPSTHTLMYLGERLVHLVDDGGYIVREAGGVPCVLLRSFPALVPSWRLA
jgi:hypothetical protein